MKFYSGDGDGGYTLIADEPVPGYIMEELVRGLMIYYELPPCPSLGRGYVSAESRSNINTIVIHREFVELQPFYEKSRCTGALISNTEDANRFIEYIKHCAAASAEAKQIAETLRADAEMQVRLDAMSQLAAIFPDYDPNSKNSQHRHEDELNNLIRLEMRRRFEP
ncbi:hypothetical protein [Aeromonas tecta]|uniref:hypothetical protein n=1 Tax=Aeromonas tecta TaxID=324617 RepID=UPI00068354CA|nr:hypothetical protein [Aeromonas tecta]